MKSTIISYLICLNMSLRVYFFFGLAACWCAGKLFHETYRSGGSYTIPICFTVLGIFVLLISVFGCCAIWKEHYKITISYLVLMIVLFILQLVIIVIIFLCKEDIIEGLQKTVDEAWNKSTAEGSPTPFLNDLQQHYKCCGKNSPIDYNLLIPLPKSCCDDSEKFCIALNAYKIGCKSAYTGWIEDNYNILKYIAIGIGVVEICGILIISFGAVILSSSVKSFEDFKDAFSHNSLPIGLIILGSVIFIIAFYGCCGAIRESYCMSMTYSVFLFILLVVQIAVVAYAFIAKEDYLKQMGIFVDRVWEKTESTRQPSYMDALQLGWKCCGKIAVTDYNIFAQVPKSCCDVGVENCNLLNSYKIGCRYEFVNWWDRNWDLMKYVGIGIGVIELSGALMVAASVIVLTHDVKTKAEDEADETKILVVTAIIIGAMIASIAFFGCFGAAKQNNCAIMTYSILLIVLLGIQIAFVAVLFMMRKEVKESVEAGLDDKWINRNTNLTEFSMLEAQFKCCGNDDPDDYRIGGFGGFFTKTCCEKDEKDCSVKTRYKVGCKQVFTEFVDFWFMKFTYAMIIVAIVEIMGFIFGCYLAKQVRMMRRRF